MSFSYFPSISGHNIMHPEIQVVFTKYWIYKADIYRTLDALICMNKVRRNSFHKWPQLAVKYIVSHDRFNLINQSRQYNVSLFSYLAIALKCFCIDSTLCSDLLFFYRKSPLILPRKSRVKLFSHGFCYAFLSLYRS